MLDILGITFPIFALIALGYGVTLKGVLKPADMRVLGGFVMNIALPALIFNAVASRSVNEVLHPAYMLTYGIGSVLAMGVGYSWFKLAGTGPNRCAIGAMGSSCPNSAFVGFPIMLLAFPSVAEPVLAMNVLVENFLTVPLALFVIEAARGEENPVSLPGKFARVVGSMLRRPFMIGLLAGLAVSMAGLSLPTPVLRLTGMLSGAAAPIALIVIGGSLVGLRLQGNRALASQIIAGKLILHPLLTAAVAAIVVALGLGFESDLRAAVILSAAMPMFTIYIVFAQESGHEGLAAIAQLGATTLAFVTLTVALALLT